MAKQKKKKVVNRNVNEDIMDDESLAERDEFVKTKDNKLEVSDKFKSKTSTLEDQLTLDIGEGFLQIKQITLRDGQNIETGPNSKFRKLAKYILRLYKVSSR